MLTKAFGGVYSNIPLKPEFKLEDVNVGVENTCLDYGDDDFTRGRPHPMIDPSLRAERVVKESLDPTVAVILADCVIGYGSHPNPAEDLADAIRTAKANAREGRPLPERHHLRLRHRGGPAVPLQDAAAAARRGRGRDAHQLAGDPPC